MKKIKITTLSIGSIAAIAMPIALAVSCAGNDENIKYDDIKNGHKLQMSDVTALSSFKTALDHAGITEEQVNNVTLQDIQDSNLKVKIDEKKEAKRFKRVKTVDDINKVLLHWAFENNSDVKAMTALNNWVNNSGLTNFTSEWPGRSVNKSDSSEGAESYWRNDLVNLISNPTLKSNDLLTSTVNAGNTRILTDYNAINGPSKGTRVTDNTMASGNAFSTTSGVNTAFSIYRTVVTGKDVRTVNSKTGDVTWEVKDEKKFNANLFDGLSVEIGTYGTSMTNVKQVTAKTNEQLRKAFDNNKDKNTIILKTGSKATKYSVAKSGDVIKTDKTFKAKDMFYGFARALFSSSQVWEEKKLNGEDISKYVEAYTNEEQTLLFNQFDGKEKKDRKEAAKNAGNPNFYLLDLFGLDVTKTLKANTEKQNNDDEFILVFKGDKGISPTSAELLKDNSLFTPFPKKALGQWSGKLSASYLKTIEGYGEAYKGAGVPNVDNIYSVAPFLYTNYDFSVGGKLEIKKNPNYIDDAWAKSDKTFSGAITKIAKKADPGALAQQRNASFTDASTTGVYNLPSEVKAEPSLLGEWVRYKHFSKVTEEGKSSAGALCWNMYGFKNDDFNDLGRKMMWGKTKVSEISSSKDSVKQFYSGTGALVRDSIHAAINWQALTEAIFPNQNKIYYPSIVLPGSFKSSGLDPSNAYPSFLDGKKDAMNIYDANLGDKYMAWKPKTASNAGFTLEKIARDAGATKERQAIIPIFKYVLKDKTPTANVVQSNRMILDRLNKLTPLVKFVNQEVYQNFSSLVGATYRKRTATTLLTNFGPDYNGIGSIMQQMLNVTGGSVGIAKDLFNKKN